MHEEQIIGVIEVILYIWLTLPQGRKKSFG